MTRSFAPLNFDGEMRVDANHAGNRQYVPNSFAHKFRPDVAEAPYRVSDGVVSRTSHCWHEGTQSEYEQPRKLWTRVMGQKERGNTCKKYGEYAQVCQGCGDSGNVARVVVVCVTR